MPNGWDIYDLDGNLVFDIDSLLDIKNSVKTKVSSVPVEQGAFGSYNKVAEPFSNKVRLAVGGPDRVAAFQTALDTEVASTDLFNIVTPTKTYLNVTLESYDHDQTAENGGVSGLVVDLAFIEVREVTPTYTTVAVNHPKNPNSGSKQTGGKGQPQKPANPPSPPWSTLTADASSAAGS